MSSGWSLPAYSGPHAVGTRLVEFAVPSCDRIELPYCPALRTIKYRSFYPTSTGIGQQPLWASRDQIIGFANFAGVASLATLLRHTLTYYLSDIHIAAISDVPISRPARGTSWPVIVFSHGLGGTDTSYSSICGNLASHGFVVFAIEHRDHSASSTIISEYGQEAEHVEYISPVNQDEPELKRRSEYMLSQRNYEIRLLMRDLSRLNSVGGEYAGHLDIERVIMAGHSFGAATCLHLLDSLNTAPTSRIKALDGTKLDIPEVPISCTLGAMVLYDIWTQPLPTKLNLQGVPIQNLISTEFSNWAINHDKLLDFVAATQVMQTDQCEKRIQGSGEMEWHVIKDSLHLSQSDGAFLFPRMIRVVSGYKRSAHCIMSENIQHSIRFLSKHYELDVNAFHHDLNEAKEQAPMVIDKVVVSQSWFRKIWPQAATLQTVQ